MYQLPKLECFLLSSKQLKWQYRHHYWCHRVLWFIHWPHSRGIQSELDIQPLHCQNSNPKDSGSSHPPSQVRPESSPEIEVCVWVFFVAAVFFPKPESELVIDFSSKIMRVYWFWSKKIGSVDHYFCWLKERNQSQEFRIILSKFTPCNCLDRKSVV